MLHTFWSVKGGSGVTVTSAIVAGWHARRDGPTLVVDLCGDLPAALGLAEPSGAGWTDWLSAPESAPAALGRLTVPVADQLSLLPVGSTRDWPDERVDDLVATLLALPRVIVDAGVVDVDVGIGDVGVGEAGVGEARVGGVGAGDVGIGGARDVRCPLGALRTALVRAGRSTLVIRPCYLALRRAMRAEGADDVLVLEEPERALSATDVATVLDLPLMASVHVDAAIARSVDAGLLARRPHRSVERALRLGS